jgi:hypothetical protein
LSGGIATADYKISNEGKVIFKDFDDNVYAIVKDPNEVFTKVIEVDLDFDSTDWLQNESLQWEIFKTSDEFTMEPVLEKSASMLDRLRRGLGLTD